MCLGRDSKRTPGSGDGRYKLGFVAPLTACLSWALAAHQFIVTAEEWKGGGSWERGG